MGRAATISIPKATTRPNAATEERYWISVDRRSPEECWPWTACVDDHGYGLIGVDGRNVRAHRLGEAIAHGPIPEGISVLHSCDNPPCQNPGHFFRGDQLANMRDAANKNRSAHGIRNGMAHLTEAVILEIRQRCATGEQQNHLARELGISKQHISQIVRGTRWRRLLGRDARDRRVVLSIADVADIRARYIGTHGQQSALAREFKVSPQCIGQIVRGQSRQGI